MEIQRINASANPPQSDLQISNAGAIDNKLENKSMNGFHDHDANLGIKEMMSAFSAFRDANDERLAQLERKSCADVLSEEKVNRISSQLDECQARLDNLALRHQRPRLETTATPAELERKSAFNAYVRSGDTSAYNRLEGKNASAVTDSGGGFSIPHDLETDIGHRLRAISPIRALATRHETTMGVYKKPFAVSGFTSGWVSEPSDIAAPEPSIQELEFPAMELYAMPAASTSLLEDSAVDIDAWIAEEVKYSFAEQEGEAFVSGNGVAKPRGILSYPQVDNDSWQWGRIGTIATGETGDLPTVNPQDILITLTHTLRASYRANGTFLMNKSTLARLRKLKDADGRYLWEPASAPGGNSTLMGFPVAESEEMPDIAADSTAIAFGDFNRGYLVVDRRGMTVLRDPFTSKPWVLFYVTKRVGGGVMDFEAIKLLKFSA